MKKIISILFASLFLSVTAHAGGMIGIKYGTGELEGTKEACTAGSNSYSAETKEIDIRKQMTESISKSVKDKKLNEKKEIEEIKERQKNLLEETSQEHVDPYEEYIEKKVKLAQLSWTYLEHINKLKEIRGIINKTRKYISDADEENPSFSKKYFQKYMETRKKAGFKDDGKELETSFMKFLVKDAELPGIDNEDLIIKEKESNDEESNDGESKDEESNDEESKN